MFIGASAAVALTPSTQSKLNARAAAALTAGSSRHPQGVRLTTTFGWNGLDEADQPMVTGFDLWFPKGSVYNGARYPKCSARVLNVRGPSGCPKASIMGSGIGIAFADTTITRPRITVVNGGADVVYFYTVLNNPARVQEPVAGHITRVSGDFTYHLSATIPENLRIVAGVPIKLTALTITAGRARWLATTNAPAGIKVVTHYDSGAMTSFLVWVQDQ
jgi:hypothetical protein